MKFNENYDERLKFLEKGSEFFQNKQSTFKSSLRVYGKINRYFSSKYFYRQLQNGETCERSWLMFSESAGKVFCFPCKLFSNDLDNVFVKNGFNNWKKTDIALKSHENSKEHHECVMKWLDHSSKNSRIDKNKEESMKSETKYWTEVLKRVISVIRFLTERGLPIRGKDEIFGSPKNGNYLGLLELLADYDAFMKDHIKNYADKGRGNASYLSKTICEELVELIAKKVRRIIVNEVQQAKYWGLVVDSTPDISHVDQLSIIFRYFLNGHVYERFFSFLPIKSHKGLSLCNEILALLENRKVEILDCRAQTYDSASNMSGKYQGLQARVKEKNPLAVYVPCVGHSLNLVGECSVDECINAIKFFSLLQNLYNFFSASTHRWDILGCTIANLSKTRWSSRNDAAKAYVGNFNKIYEALSTIEKDDEQKAEVRQEAKNLLKQMRKRENALMAVFWHQILERFHKTNQYLQKIDVDLITASKMLESLVLFVQNLRNDFSKFEEKAKSLSPRINSDYTDKSTRCVTKKLADGELQEENLRGSDKFRIQTYYVIIDKLSTELEKRSTAYNYVVNLFGFLTKLLTIDDDTLEASTKKLVEAYHQDLSSDLYYELKQFTALLKRQKKGLFSCRSTQNEKEKDEFVSPLKILNWMVDSEMVPVFPYVYVAFRLLVTIPIANCESERSFSVLKRIKNMLRSTMLNDRLSGLALLNIESDILRSLDFDEIISEFVKSKNRRRIFI